MIQLQVLNKILQENDTSFIIDNNLNEDYFSDYKNEFNWIYEHISKYGNCPDMLSFLEKFPEFDTIEVKESKEYLLAELTEDYNKRKLAVIFNHIRELLNADKTDEALTYYSSALGDITKNSNQNSVDIITDTSRYDRYVEKCNDYNKFYVKTGFEELDKVIGGWDRYEELATIVARPGVGKSFFLQKVAIAAAEQGLKVGIYSGEMSENKVGYRIDTLISHISNSSIIRGNPDIQVEYKKYLESLRSRIKGSIKVLTPNMINGSAGVTALRSFIEKENLDILCVDQHSLLEDDRKARTPVERAANISKDLKNLQVLKRIPIIAVSQQNRMTADEQNTSQVAQTDRISQDSTILIFLEHKDNLLTVNLVKSRDSVNGKKFVYAVDLDKGIFEFVPDEHSVSKEEIKELKDSFDNNDVAEGDDIF